MELRLSADALAQLEALCTGSRGRETGGLLIGTRDDQRAFVWAVTGPGNGAVAHRRALLLDTSFVLGVLTGVDIGGVVEVLGRWHKHVALDLRASDDDRIGADAFRQVCEFASGAASTVELIVATDDDRPVGHAAYLCTKAGLCRIAIRESPHLPQS